MVASVAHGNHQWVTRHACSGEPRAIAEQREAGQARRVRQVATKRLHEDSRASNVRVKMTSDTRGRREKEVSQTSSNVCVVVPGHSWKTYSLDSYSCSRSGQERTLLPPTQIGRASTERSATYSCVENTTDNVRDGSFLPKLWTSATEKWSDISPDNITSVL